MKTESREASARRSAQDTTPGQLASSLALMASTTSKAAREKLMSASFSEGMPSTLSRRTDASQP